MTAPVEDIERLLAIPAVAKLREYIVGLEERIRTLEAENAGLREALDAGTPAERAAVVLWSAVGAWTDAPQGRWGALADAGADLGDALDVGGTVVPRRATALRETMTVVWRTMEERR